MIRHYVAANASALVVGNALANNTNQGAHPDDPLSWRHLFLRGYALEAAPIPVYYLLSFESTRQLADMMRALPKNATVTADVGVGADAGGELPPHEQAEQFADMVGVPEGLTAVLYACGARACV